MRAAGLLLAVAALGACGGCCATVTPVTPEPGASVAERGPAPAYEDVAARYNARVAEIDRFWARATTRMWYTDEEGEEQSDQADGYLQHIAPHNVLLEITRFGKRFALLGANDEHYWWISLADDERMAIVGAHDETTPEAAARAGLPVHPLDLLALLGAAPLAPESGAGEAWWSEDGRRLMVASRARWGRIMLTLDPETLEPARVEMAREGRPAVTSELGEYMPYARRADPSDVRMPGEVMIYAHESGARIRMRPYDYRATSDQPNPRAFNMQAQLRGNRIAPQNIRRVEDGARDLSERAPARRSGSGAQP